MHQNTLKTDRKTIFISKATPEDDEFVLWLAPRLEAAGYEVFADILTLEYGERWRKKVTETLQNKSIKMLLCCRDSTLAKNGVQEEIGIAEDLAKDLDDKRFIIPLRLEKFKKIFGIGELQYVDFLGSWANGLNDLMNSLDRQNIPRSVNGITINPNWEQYKKRLAIKVEETPEVLTSNWLRIIEVPENIRYYYPSGAINHSLMSAACKNGEYPAEVYHRGFFSFASPEEIANTFSNAGKFVVHSEHNLIKLLDDGAVSPNIKAREANNLVLSLFRKSWEKFCLDKGLLGYMYSKQMGFHISANQLAIGKRISWGQPGKRRNSMLRNISQGKVWQYGVSVTPFLWPYPHFKLKSRVLFSELSGNESGNLINDTDAQHRLRKSICSSWRNKAWHGRLMAFLEVLAGESKVLALPLSNSSLLCLDAAPVLVTSPVTTVLPDVMDGDAEENDLSTLGNYMIEAHE